MDFKDARGLTPVVLAAAMGNARVVAALARGGADVGIVVSGGATVAHMCADGGHDARGVSILKKKKKPSRRRRFVFLERERKRSAATREREREREPLLSCLFFSKSREWLSLERFVRGDRRTGRARGRFGRGERPRSRLAPRRRRPHGGRGQRPKLSIEDSTFGV